MRLTEGGGGVSADGAGHEEVGDLAQGEEAGWIVSLVHLLLDQAFQLVLKRLRRTQKDGTDHNAAFAFQRCSAR